MDKKQNRTIYMRKWRKNNKDRYLEINREGNRKYRLNRYLQYILSKRKYTQKIRLELIGFFGGKCIKCGFSDWRALHLDHKNGGGNKERKESNNNYMNYFYKEMKQEPERLKERLQLLCANCNWIKRYENKEVANFNKQI